MKLPLILGWTATATAAVLLPAAQMSPQPRQAHTSGAAAVLQEFSNAISELAAGASRAVVLIEVHVRVPLEETDKRQAGFVAQQRASGSGVLIDPAGYIVTNAHVVAGAQKIDVAVLEPGRSGPGGDHRHYAAKLVGIDKETDLALLKIDATGLDTLSFADSDQLRQGQVVLALGSPLGLADSLTVGFVSAPHRHLQEQDPMYYIQTDASINPGNSGGPLLDILGRIAGINTLILSHSGGSEGIGFSIPSNTVQRVVKRLRADGRIQRGSIGVLAEDITPTLAKALGLDRDMGIILSDVAPHSAAEAADLAPGDIVLSIDGKRSSAVHELIGAIFEHAVGDRVTLEVVRAGQRMSKAVTVMERRHAASLAEIAEDNDHLVRELGIFGRTVDGRVTAVLGDLRRLYGVAVAAIPAEYVAANPGLLAGDVIYELNGKRVADLEQLRAALATKKSGDPMALLVERDEKLIYVSFQLE